MPIPEALAIDLDQGIKGKQVVEAMDRIASVRGSPRAIRVDNGTEFISKALDRWAYENGFPLRPPKMVVACSKQSVRKSAFVYPASADEQSVAATR